MIQSCANREKEKTDSESSDKNTVVRVLLLPSFLCRFVNGWIKQVWQALNMSNTIWFCVKKKLSILHGFARFRGFAVDAMD